MLVVARVVTYLSTAHAVLPALYAAPQPALLVPTVTLTQVVLAMHERVVKQSERQLACFGVHAYIRIYLVACVHAGQPGDSKHL